jgi:ATP-dependent Clp protease adaptor protein ClpS
MDWYRDGENIQQAPVTTIESKSSWTHPETGTRSPRKAEVKAKRPSMWSIVFYNDDYTPMDFVVFAVTKVFHRSTEDALALTLAVHTQGKGIAGTYTFEVAEQKQFEVLLMAKIEEHPLRVEVERA